jgi:hypothetical protein
MTWNRTHPVPCFFVFGGMFCYTGRWSIALNRKGEQDEELVDVGIGIWIVWDYGRV